MPTYLAFMCIVAQLVPVALPAENLHEARIYVSGPGGIGRMNLDGSAFEILIESDERRPGDLAMDWKEGKLYWSDMSAIHRSEFDGSQLEVFAPQSDVFHCGTLESCHVWLTGFSMEIDPDKRFLFFTASLDGHVPISRVGFVHIDRWEGGELDLFDNRLYEEFPLSHDAEIGGANVAYSDSSGTLFCFTLGDRPDCLSFEWHERGALGSPVPAWPDPLDHFLLEKGGNYWNSRNEFNYDTILVNRAFFPCGYEVPPDSDTLAQMAIDRSRGIPYTGTDDGRIAASFCNDGGEFEVREIHPDLGSSDPPRIVDMTAHNGNLFWANVQGEIVRWHDDGSEDGSLTKVFAPAVRRPRGLFVDHEDARILWTDPVAQTIMQANLDGSDIQVLVEGQQGDVQDVLVAEGRLYWSESARGAIRSANRDGSDLKESILPQGHSPGDLDYDPMDQKLYWTSGISVGRSNLDGSNVEVVELGMWADDIAVDWKQGAVYVAAWSWESAGVWKIDFVTGHLAPLYHGLERPISIDVSGDDVYLSLSDPEYPAYLTIRHMDQMSGSEAALVSGYGLLAERIALYQPDEVETALDGSDLRIPGPAVLHANYPNPFNSSTRIPYTVSRDGPVSLTIHNTLGQPVASLVDEARQAGTYEALWSTEGEEALASGVYLARLVAADAVQVRRLALLR